MYWPKEGTETYGYIQVKLLQEVVMATYTLRTFTAKNLRMKKRSGSDRTVYQYHYTNWPDHGVPDHPLPVLSFVRKSASANPPGAGAIICHCSAGCGRSGTYIVIDAMLKQIRQRQSINVVDFLKHIRSQRNYLVQTEEQYIFIHDSLVEAIESGETEIASNFIAKYLQLLQTGNLNQTVAALSSNKNSNYSMTNGFQSPPGQQQAQLSVTTTDQHLVNSQSNLLLNANGGAVTLKSNSKGSLNTVTNNSATATSGRSGSQSASSQWSLLERQYRLVASFKAKDFNVVSALKPCNKQKNRTLNLIPLEAHRVHITPKPGTDGSDYINATFLMGFNHLREFILTQHPVYETFSDFWQMVYDHNSQTIVLLTQMNDYLLKEFPQFWPQKEDEVDYGSFKVKLTQESTLMKTENGGLIITRDFIMRSNQDDYELQTKIIHCPGWPECCGPLSSVFDLIQVVQNATQQQASQQKMHDGHTTTTTVTIGQEHEPQNGGPIIVVDKFGGTEAATFAVLTTLFKQINFEDAVDVYMYAKLAHLRRPGIWSSQDDYLFLYRAIENYASSMNEAATNQASSLAALSSGITPTINFHHQTMTLDRHKHKSASSLKHNTSSTMRRSSNKAISQTTAEILSKSNNHLLIDHNHNQLISSPTQASNLMMQQLQQHHKQLQHHQQQQQRGDELKAIKSQFETSTGNNNNTMNSNNSPYSSYQHLLAGNGRSLNSSSNQPVVIDSHHYPMS